jgi:hypothetical protein
MSSNHRFSHRDPITLRVLRTVRDSRLDAYDWWECFERPSLTDRRGRTLRRRLKRAWRNLLRWLHAPSPWERRP